MSSANAASVATGSIPQAAAGPGDQEGDAETCDAVGDWREFHGPAGDRCQVHDLASDSRAGAKPPRATGACIGAGASPTKVAT